MAFSPLRQMRTRLTYSHIRNIQESRFQSTEVSSGSSVKRTWKQMLTWRLFGFFAERMCMQQHLLFHHLPVPCIPPVQSLMRTTRTKTTISKTTFPNAVTQTCVLASQDLTRIVCNSHLGIPCPSSPTTSRRRPLLKVLTIKPTCIP